MLSQQNSFFKKVLSFPKPNLTKKQIVTLAKVTICFLVKLGLGKLRTFLKNEFC